LFTNVVSDTGCTCPKAVVEVYRIISIGDLDNMTWIICKFKHWWASSYNSLTCTPCHLIYYHWIVYRVGFASSSYHHSRSPQYFLATYTYLIPTNSGQVPSWHPKSSQSSLQDQVAHPLPIADP
jgi:hypothetical protein